MRGISMILLAIFAFATTIEVSAMVRRRAPSAGELSTQGQPKTVHIVPHSHNDEGWVETLDEYYDYQNVYTPNGQKRYLGVRHIYTEAIEMLLQDARRTFLVAEMKFFYKWWHEQDDAMQSKTRQLIQRGQLEIVNAGWSMHDEACPIFEDMIDNMMMGHEWILTEFGVRPRIAWQIDTFGHSNTNARLFAEMGFDALFISRADEGEKLKRAADRELEFVWTPSAQSLGTDVNIFTHILFYHYEAPPGFNFEPESRDPPFVADQSSKQFNAWERSRILLQHLDERSAAYRTDDILCLFGKDFGFKEAHRNFQMIDSLINFMNANYGDRYFFKYSTPSQYIDAVKAYDIRWPTRTNDMFPYSSDGHFVWWTGFFTSRPNFKSMTRVGSTNLHASQILYAQKMLDQSAPDAQIQSILDATNTMKDQMGVLVHHDAITGTSKDRVHFDYIKHLLSSVGTNNKEYGRLISEKIAVEMGLTSNEQWQQCGFIVSSYFQCPLIQKYAGDDNDLRKNKKLITNIAVHNPSSLDLDSLQVHIPAQASFRVEVFDTKSQTFRPVDSEKFCFSDHLYDKQFENCFLDVQAKTPAWALTLIKLESTDTNSNGESHANWLLKNDQSEPKRHILHKKSQNSHNMVKESYSDDKREPIISRNGLTVKYAGVRQEDSVVMFDVYDEANPSKEPEQLEFSLKYWNSYFYEERWQDPLNSGAYQFHQLDGQYDPLPYGDIKEVAVTPGKNTQIIDITFGKYLKSEDKVESMKSKVQLSIDNELPLLKFEVDLDSLPLQQQDTGYEVVANFHVKNFDNNEVFYTDANGLEMQKRILNKRPTWDLQTNCNITDNFYPVTTAISIRDANSQRQLTVMNDRTQGGTSIKPGTIELMQNRATPGDDLLGLRAPLRDLDSRGQGQRVKATYYLQIFDGQYRQPVQRQAQQKIVDPPIYFFNFDVTGTDKHPVADQFAEMYKAAGVRDTIKIVHMPKGRNVIQLRLENLADHFDPDSKSVTLDLEKIAQALWTEANRENTAAAGFDSLDIAELSMQSTMQLNEMKQRKLKWLTQDAKQDGQSLTTVDYDLSVNKIKLEPQRIRVFELKFTPTQNSGNHEELFLKN